MKLRIYPLLYLVFLTSVASASQAVEVKMKSLSYDPKRVEIAQGQ